MHKYRHIQTSRPQVGSGNGLWADALRARGADVVAYDTPCWAASFNAFEEGEAVGGDRVNPLTPWSEEGAEVRPYV